VVEPETENRKDVYGSIDDVVVRQAQLLRPEQSSRTAFVAMHPIGAPGYLPAFSHLARRGLHVIACGTRYTSVTPACRWRTRCSIWPPACATRRSGWLRADRSRRLERWWVAARGYQAERKKRQITHTAAGESTSLADAELITPTASSSWRPTAAGTS